MHVFTSNFLSYCLWVSLLYKLWPVWGFNLPYELHQQVTSCKLWRQVGESFKPPKYDFDQFSSARIPSWLSHLMNIYLNYAMRELNLVDISCSFCTLSCHVTYVFYAGHAQLFHGPSVTSMKRYLYRFSEMIVIVYNSVLSAFLWLNPVTRYNYDGNCLNKTFCAYAGSVWFL
jgi:hypothetical protein